ncbi:MAG TPA: AMP-binding protein [Pyrinomonadaceae bacterium]|jgi:acyl-CoA synthetase (AMP-forming)/AMP-acid ligase II|nr:AMP-binding protein [Pyrinomonadaceae bacterium]
MSGGNGNHKGPSSSRVESPDERVTLGRALLRRLEEEPDATACWLVGGGGESARVTVRELMERAYAFAVRYGSAKEGRKIVAVCLYHGPDLHAAFVGALLAGHVPTMIAPPSPRMEAAKYTDSFCRMLAHIRPSCVVADGAALEKLDALALREFPDSELVDAETVRGAGAGFGEFETWEGDAEEVALLQHSSGTTGLQKGVALSHRAVLRHNRAYAGRIGLTREDVIVSWLPLYHDMGFVACFLLPLLSRVPFVELSPFDWVLRPVSLFEQINAHRATLCWMPNFAFQFMADSVRPSQLASLSLASVRAWVNCSEPVHHSAHSSFIERFAGHGVSETQLTASYAMAENVFAVTQSRAGGYRVLGVNRRLFREEHRVETDDAEGALAFVSNGAPVEGTEVAVVDERGRAMPEGRVGELAIRGEYLFSGYFRREDLTREALTADGWYKTGDLGFVREGEVYVTGRKKDLIIVQGRNFYPADVERVVSGVEGVTHGRVVVFGLANERTGTEGLIVLAESEESEGGRARRLSLRIRNAVAQELDCTPQDVRVVPPRWLVKSTAGKLARADNRSKYLKNFVKVSGTSPAYV